MWLLKQHDLIEQLIKQCQGIKAIPNGVGHCKSFITPLTLSSSPREDDRYPRHETGGHRDEEV